MTTNLRGSEAEGGYRWKFDVPAARELYEDYKREDMRPRLLATPTPSLADAGASLFVVRAERNSAWAAPGVAEDCEAVAASSGGAVRFLDLANAGHWVHTDAPGPLSEMIRGESLGVL